MTRPSTSPVSDRPTATGRKPTRWLLRRPDEDAAARIFCFPYAGVGASMYAGWPPQVGPAEVCLLQLPGRENRLHEPHYGDYHALADQLIEQLLPYLDRPFGFFGHCSGAMPGYATALRLMLDGLPTPATLFVSSQVAPHHGPHSRFLSMTDDELRVELAGLVAALGGIPDPDLLTLGLGVLRRDVEAYRQYRVPGPVVLPGRITAIGWSDDPEITPEQLTGWGRYAAPERFRRVVLPGAHYSFLSAPEALLAELAVDMELAVAAAEPEGRT
ncbi:thioesterase II family protein [Jatrophihabitans sp.]|uniref:thioesterase II family protein n=1 Tax=Jatrophihabitans sp. TaxID=1932789 RepID=UPI002B71CC4F|nr:thioesterase domain-containing protein [Jatrophihabitans sp.]